MKLIMNSITVVFLSFSILVACSSSDIKADDGSSSIPQEDKTLAERNVLRAIKITDKAISSYFVGGNMKMSRYYNPYTKVASSEVGSVWMYTSSIEAVNAILKSLKSLKDNGKEELYNNYFDHYSDLLLKLYSNADFYKGTYTLTSFTQTKEWTVYGVNRGKDKGAAVVEGIENVYDDQQWLVRELLEAYSLTDNELYLREAEYLTEYIIDGWDTTLDANGNENGGIPWGPGYVTKHSCSNGPMVSPLVWLHELYKDKNDVVSYRYITSENKREDIEMKKSDFYLEYAKKIYNWQKTNLLRSDGVYDDMMGGCDPNCGVAYEVVDGERFRKNTILRDMVGPAITYNSGTMLSGAADLYRATGDNMYLIDAEKLSDNSFKYFAKLGITVPEHYTFSISGFNNWFNGVLMRGYFDIYPSYRNVNEYIDSFQKNLDYGYDNFIYEDILPINLLVGWSLDNSKNNVEGMFTFSFAAQYAVLAQYQLEKR